MPTSPPSMHPLAEQNASILSRLVFHWIHPLILRGTAQPLQQQDLPPLQPNDSAQNCHPIFYKNYQQQIPDNPPSFPINYLSKTYRALLPVVYLSYFQAALWKPGWLAGAISQAFSIRALVTYVTRAAEGDITRPSRWLFIPVVFALAISALLMSVSHHSVFFRSMRAGMRARAALSAEIFRKTLRLSPTALARTSEGEIGNLLLNDTQRVLDSFTYFHFCWSGFIEILVMVALLCIDLGMAAMFGLLVLMLLIPIQFFFSTLVTRARKQTTAQVDVRVQKMTEILSGIRTVKLSAWEPHFLKVVADLRHQEVKHLKVAAVVRAANTAFFFTTPVMVALAAFTARTLLFRQPLSPATIFSSLSYFWSISMSLSLMPVGYLAASEATVSSKRLDAFFDLPELPAVSDDKRLDSSILPSVDGVDSSDTSSDCPTSDLDDIDDMVLTPCKTNFSKAVMPRVWTKQAQFSYAQSGEKENGLLATVLKDITFSVDDGQLLSIVGPVGSGKSSLLLGILGENLCTHGEVSKQGRVAYCAQQPWIVNSSLRENITMFGEDGAVMDHEWYQTVLDACCLLPDLQLLPAGDLTEIGERGVNLSGGQKARVALARAVFSKADIYLLDDPLSAVDVAVSARLIQKVFGPKGLLADKVQLIVTHQLNLLPVSSSVAVLGGETIDNLGTFEELRERGVEFSGFSNLENDVDRKRRNTGLEHVSFEEESDLAHTDKDCLRQFLKDEEVDVSISELRESYCNGSGTSCNFDIDSGQVHADVAADALCDLEQSSDTKAFHQKGELVAEEDRQLGRVTKNVYHAYVKAGGGYFVLFVVAAGFICAQAVRQVSEWWLSRWSDVAAANSDADALFTTNRFHALVYFGLTAFTMLLTLIRAAFFAERSMSASKTMHKQLLDRVLHARMSFFDTNPIGRILNRFSKDIDQMDSMLPFAAQDFLQISFVALGALITIAIILPWFILPLVPIVGGFVLLQRMYKKCSRELKRIEALSRSPLYAQLVETSNGLSTIRAHETEGRFSAMFNCQIDENHVAYHMFTTSGRWLGIRLDTLAALVAFSTSLVVLILSPNLNPGLAGVALTQSIVMTGTFQWGIRQAAETENLFTSVERVSEMATQTPVEKPYEIPEKRPDASWPSEGRICFDKVTLKYRPELDPALHNVSFKTGVHERIGIVGRTGSGKSSLFVSLFRLVELTEGTIFIDGIDIAEMGLHDLRSRMAIVPQDPVLFNGTIRSNLDPTGAHNDAQLWDALHRVHMKPAIQGLDGTLDGNGYGLDLVVHEKGSNFSSGERQLLALARAILSGVQVVVLDEASASLDNHTDMLVQKTVREELSDRTVLTIAHRLATIADSDRILVMEAGEVVEFDTPLRLIEIGGYFARLVEETGRIESVVLKAIIAEASNSAK